MGPLYLLEADNRPELLSDVVTDAYEALEGLAKIVTERDKELAANLEMFLKNIQASEAYKRIIKEYIAYANNYRHAVSQGKQKPTLSLEEVESFVYLTGLFLRLAMSAESRFTVN